MIEVGMSAFFDFETRLTTFRTTFFVAAGSSPTGVVETTSPVSLLTLRTTLRVLGAGLLAAEGAASFSAGTGLLIDLDSSRGVTGDEEDLPTSVASASAGVVGVFGLTREGFGVSFGFSAGGLSGLAHEGSVDTVGLGGGGAGLGSVFGTTDFGTSLLTGVGLTAGLGSDSAAVSC